MLFGNKKSLYKYQAKFISLIINTLNGMLIKENILKSFLDTHSTPSGKFSLFILPSKDLYIPVTIIYKYLSACNSRR